MLFLDLYRKMLVTLFGGYDINTYLYRIIKLKSMKIEVSNKRLDTHGRSEWDRIASPKTKRQAFAIAKKASKKSIETEVLCTDEQGDVCGHYYFENGKLAINMSV